ncbi:MAG: hypothetical protein M5U23_09555 [Acidimicrobiia bacterium]|nr:hypothetical protein [Acidimicrobiia bacterium]
MPHPRSRLLVVGVVFAAFVASCSSSSQTDNSTNPPSDGGAGGTTTSAQTGDTATSPPADEPSGAAAGECTVTVSGDLEGSWTYPQTRLNNFSSDYWTTEQEEREALSIFDSDNSRGTYEEIIARGEPIVTFFTLGCGPDDDMGVGAALFSTEATVADQMPMGPGSYPISGDAFDLANGPPQTMMAFFTPESEPDSIWNVLDAGSVEITKWDGTEVRGTFSLDAAESEAFVDNPRSIHVDGTFDYLCTEELMGHTPCG